VIELAIPGRRFIRETVFDQNLVSSRTVILLDDLLVVAVGHKPPRLSLLYIAPIKECLVKDLMDDLVCSTTTLYIFVLRLTQLCVTEWVLYQLESE